MAWDWASDGGDLARLIAENSADIVCRLDSAGVVDWVADSVSDSLGWKPDELVGRTLIDVVGADDLGLMGRLRDGVTAGHAVGVEPEERPAVRWYTSDGTVRWVSGTAIPQQRSDGEMAGVVVALRDVTDLVQARIHAQTYALQWQATVDSLLDPFVVLTPVRDEGGHIRDFVFTLANAAAANDQQISVDDLVGSHFLTLFPHLEDQGVFEAYATVLDTGEPLVLDGVKLFNDVLDGARIYDIRAAKAGDTLVLTWRDVTQRHTVQEQLAQRETVYRMATESEYDAVLQVDDQGRLQWASPSFEQIIGYPIEDLVGESAYRLVAPGDLPDVQGAFSAAMAGHPSPPAELRLLTADGTRKWVKVRSRVVEGAWPGEASLMTMLRDIDADVRAREAFEENLRVDPLTGIATWRAMRADLDNGRPNALLCIGLDRLRAINEAISYAGGDEVLVGVVRRIADAIPPTATIGRVAGNELAVAVPEVADRSLLAILAEQIADAVSTPMNVLGQDLLPTVSIGIAHADEVPEELLRRASLAMRAARVEGGGRWLFDDPVVAAEAERRLWIESRVREALSRGAIVPWFQPVVRLTDRQVVGYEALARWPQTDGEVLPPSEFLTVAESSGLVVDLDLAILEQSLAAVRDRDDVTVSVNVSARTLVLADYAQRVTALLDATGFDPARLRLEVTETALLYDENAAQRATSALALRGVKWWLDDFGTGYSTLTHLRDFPISGIKLDRSFTVGVGEEDLAPTRLARALIGMAQGLGLETVAEGVENSTQERLLREQGWQNAQGWLYGKAAPNLPTRRSV